MFVKGDCSLLSLPEIFGASFDEAVIVNGEPSFANDLILNFGARCFLFRGLQKNFGGQIDEKSMCSFLEDCSSRHPDVN